MAQQQEARNGLAGLRVLLGVSGGIAAYKACELVRRLRDAGADVRVVLTENAARFVTPLTFQALSGQPVRTSLWDENAEAAMGHLELAHWAQRILIAPASADLIARLAHGFADDLLTTLYLASLAPVAIAPAMNLRMWAHAATQANVAALRARGVNFFGPADGPMAEPESGPGRLLEPPQIVAELAALHGPKLLTGKRVLVSAGPTFEDIDPVRFIGNRSSGRMGFAVAQAAVEQGASVELVAGPVHLPTPAGVARVDVRSARDMREAVMARAPTSDIYIAAAAVGDFRPQEIAAHKLKKTGNALTLTLNENPDILAGVAALKQRPFVVGFAAETQNVENYARAKLERKKLDLIAANKVGEGEGFDARENEILLISRDGAERLARADKLELARQLVARVAESYAGRNPSAKKTPRAAAKRASR
ncbi:MAG: bifunctional phosphopantothenoylcysteine decarboxylase/phosphopantothenate--cysteine ligase CoaBC [Rudaea sp.]|uniref:bifunctional phosphopantothenoylcysteine decarboxylase/phosphopantothenate--cysteine ligase CoaBC n=1 Tax=unclassified Rudaea TaxID=2627037 RepID=UPI0010F84244|nr:MULTISPECIES: bifunctional phosphopantothenoylcysteine decarboxylase/phosphopantothenate--cysteine ligase CoaBC [unclassified Rudaea]MBN8885196.1 bifunctional phosphopantothenoylcysteine decarboxylase/phosphopantothenate--cysteine ligase CoaBC [Rudaea sp.]MBR0347159.1 bifunctional phosphopantothenoylcysteine decarboxylase/phosphopantothenate--cysteine ligase CoaBC [Rudaea sp.]